MNDLGSFCYDLSQMRALIWLTWAHNDQMRLQAAASGAGCSPNARLLLPHPLLKPLPLMPLPLLATSRLPQRRRGTRRVRRRAECLSFGGNEECGTMSAVGQAGCKGVGQFSSFNPCDCCGLHERLNGGLVLFSQWL